MKNVDCGQQTAHRPEGIREMQTGGKMKTANQY